MDESRGTKTSPFVGSRKFGTILFGPYEIIGACVRGVGAK
jgi:hypothetical protein